MPEPNQHHPATDGQIVLLLDLLFDELVAAGFAREQTGVRLQLRVAELLSRLTHPASTEQLKYQLAALICRSAEEQEKFYRIFDSFADRYRIVETSSSSRSEPDNPIKEQPLPEPIEKKEITPPLIATPPAGKQPPKYAQAARSGPFTVELSFRDDGYRPWNLPEFEAAIRPLREKEWTDAQDWDIPSSIRKTIRSGGIPHFVRRRRRKAPQYLFLIEQKSSRDHLAGLYADLVTELQRRDVDADCYFYEHVPYRCWKDRRDPATFTTLDRLGAIHRQSRLILVGEPDGLLALSPRKKEEEQQPADSLFLSHLFPSALAFRLREEWPAVALLDTRSTAVWDGAEEALHQLFPIAPATVAGLGRLMEQWVNHSSFRPYFWKIENPEPIPPSFQNLDRTPESLQKGIRNLKIYLGKYGFNWLCAIAVYPELYWPLTKLLHDEAISKKDVNDESLRTQLWQISLLRMSRLEWLRRGRIPAEYRKQLRQLLPGANAADVRRQLLDVLNLKENKPEKGTYAETDRNYTVALLKYEKVLARQPNEQRRAMLDAAFRRKIEDQGLALSDITDNVGRSILRDIKAAPPPQLPGFWILWVDDKPENNTRFQEELGESMYIRFVNATSTDEALLALNKQSFDLIISDMERGDNPQEGLEMLRAIRERGISTTAFVFSSSSKLQQFREELASLDVDDVSGNWDEQKKFIARLVTEKQNAGQTQGQYESNKAGKNTIPEAALRAAKAVCRVVCADGSLATGFLTQDGYLFTCNHVIPSAEMANTARVEFTDESDPAGKSNPLASYQLDASDFITSPQDQLDFTRVKITDRPGTPLSQWGGVEFDSSIPARGAEISIIHHPKGESKQVTTGAGTIAGQHNQYLFYNIYTEGGSAGAPVLDANWKVVALHHANKTVTIDGTPQKVKEGILFRDIFEYIRKAEKEKVKQTFQSLFKPDSTKFLIVYDLADTEHCIRLNKHLNVLKLTKKISVYNVIDDVPPGENVLERAKFEMNVADYILPLITVNWFNSPDWFELVFNAVGAGRRIIPIRIEKADYEGTGLEKLNSLPTQGRCVAEFKNPDEAYTHIAEELQKVLPGYKSAEKPKTEQSTLKAQIQELIAAGQTKDALEFLVKVNPDTLLLQAQYNNGEKQFNLGLIDFGEWQRIQARVNFAALEMAQTADAKLKAQIQELIAAGQTKDALELLVKINPDALLLLAQYNNGEKQFDLGLIDFSEWQRIQARMRFATLEMAEKSPAQRSGDSSKQDPAQKEKSKPVVYISYNHKDKDSVQRITDYLRANNVDVILDMDDMKAGQRIEDFITESVRKSDFALSIISDNSLQSAWVSYDTQVIWYAEQSNKTKWIPCRLDNTLFDKQFFSGAMENAESKIKELKSHIKELLDMNASISAINSDLERWQNHRNQLPQILNRLKNILSIDLSGDRFESGMKQILDIIQKN